MNIYREIGHVGFAVEKTAGGLWKHKLTITVAAAFCYIVFKMAGAEPAAAVVFILLSLGIILCSITQITYFMFFFTPLFLYVTIGTFPIYNVIILALFLKRCFLEKAMIPLYPLLAVLLLAIIELAGMLFSGIGFTANQIKFFIIILITAMQLYSPPEGYDNRLAAKYLIYGTALFAAFYIAENFNTVLNSSTRTGGLGELDPNTYALYNLFALSVVILFLLSRTLGKRETVLYGIIAVVLIMAGLMTLSKTFVLCLCFMFVLYFIASRRKISILVITSLLSAFVVLLVQNNSFMNGVYNTIIARFTASSMMSGLTTGRSDIYSAYLATLSQNPLICFTGSGMYSYLQTLGIEIRPHNCAIEMICSWGIIGTGAMVYMYIKGKDRYKRHIQYQGRVLLASAVPLVTLLAFMQSLTLMFQEATYAYLCMAIMVMYDTGLRREPMAITECGRDVYEKNAVCDLVAGYRRGGKKPHQSAHDAHGR